MKNIYLFVYLLIYLCRCDSKEREKFCDLLHLLKPQEWPTSNFSSQSQYIIKRKGYAIDKMITKGKLLSLIFYQILPTYAITKCMEIS